MHGFCEPGEPKAHEEERQAWPRTETPDHLQFRLPPANRGEAAVTEPGAGTFRIKITLVGSDPLIWRRIEVPAQTTLESLHRIIQSSFEWDNSHLHQFEVPSGVVSNEQSAGLPEPGSTLHYVYVYVYVYDFGDDWVHEILRLSAALIDCR
ncbi:plasmid pRiA4b ORF-3 family protein [Lentzea californiensis]|uniref:plasmid pRiA4b ORF-3 family protein n=1 Tax=Lentzea californiensis TaxID=438851 RepID=UPI0027DFB312|nr:plasmid pRiA4b ORF-3 family protein [Lentzea californiensis]